MFACPQPPNGPCLRPACAGSVDQRGQRGTHILDQRDQRALVTLVVVLVLQTAMHGSWVLVREPGTLWAIARTWRTSSQVGLFAALGSACWFTGFAMAPVAFVRLVGQVEVLLTLGFGHWYLPERVRAHEAAGLVLVSLGVALALAAAF